MNLQIQRSATIISYLNPLSLCGLSSPYDDLPLMTMHQHNSKLILNFTFSNSLNDTIKEPQCAIHKFEATTKKIKKEDRLYMKPLDALCAKGVFQIQLPISGGNFSNNISIPHIT